jgi:CheY-like chemotaxis protein
VIDRPRILVVDDAATARFALAAVLGSRFEVHMATNGRAAIRAAAELRPHLILMDVVMPVLGGLEACEELRAQDATRTTPVILVTTRGDEWDVEAGYASGCTDYVTKPVDRIELLAKIDSWLGAVPDGAA